MTIGNPSYWSEIIQKWQSSGCNMREFCRQENISVHTFKYWKYKLAGSKNSEPVQQELVKISEPAKLVPVKASVIEEFRRNNSNQNIDFTKPVRIIYENGIFKQINQ